MASAWTIGIIALIVVWVAVTFNSFVRLRNKVREAFSGIDVQLRRRVRSRFEQPDRAVPANLFAPVFGIRRAEFFEVESAAERQAPSVALERA